MTQSNYTRNISGSIELKNKSYNEKNALEAIKLYLSLQKKSSIVSNVSNLSKEISFDEKQEDKISQEELFATGGEKNYQIEFVGGNGTTIYLDVKTFVYDASYSVPTFAALPLGFSENVTILEDGSLDLEGLYITIYYNGKESSMSNPDLIPETDHVEVPLSSEDVKIEYVVDGNTAIIVSISIKINFNGHEVYHMLTNH